jgi:hypothetical protein
MTAARNKAQSVVATAFPLGVYDDANVVYGNTSYFQTEVNDLNSHNLDSVLFTNGDSTRDGPILGVADQSGTNVYWGPVYQLDREWWPTTVPADATIANNVIAPLVTAVAGHPSLKGTYLVDEPGLDLATKVALGTQAYHQLDPSRPVFPMLIGLDRIGPIFNDANPDIMSIDVYPFGSTNPIGDFTMTGFGYYDLDMVGYIRSAVATKPAGVPLWITLQTQSWGTPGASYSLRTPVPAEVRAVNWIALGEGAHGIFWFIYSSEQGWTGLKDNTTLFPVVGQLSQRVGPLRSTLSTTQKVADAFTASYAPASAGTPVPTSTPYASTLSDGTNTYVVVANMDCVNPQNLQITSTLAGNLQSLETGQVYAQGSPIWLDAGDGTIFKLTTAPVTGTVTATRTGTKGPTSTPTGTPTGTTSSDSDEFNVGGPTPNPQWTFVGGGSSSADVNHLHPGDLRITIDPSASRSCWVGSMTCLQLLEQAPVGDFTLDTKLDTLPPLGSSDVHSAGLIAYQDANNFIRFELQSYLDPTNWKVSAHQVINGVGSPDLLHCSGLANLRAPFYLRVTRAGNSWTLAYSQDGQSFTSCGSYNQPLNLVSIGTQVENEGNLTNFGYADFDYVRVSPASTTPTNGTPTPSATPWHTSTPTPTATQPVAGGPTATPTRISTASPGGGGVPSVEPNYGLDINTWWASHPLNPNAPGGIAIGAIPNPSPVINLSAAGDLNGTINSSQCASGCTIVLSDGATYGSFTAYNLSHVHIIANNGATISGRNDVMACSGAENYAQFDFDVWSNNQTPEPYYNNGTARQCFQNQVSDWYFNHITFDGGNSANQGLVTAAARDIVCDNCTFQNYAELNVSYEISLWDADRGVDNHWCRQCHFVGSQRMAIFWDGMHGGGIIDSTFESSFYAMFVDVSTNDDFTIDLNGDGAYSQSEQRDGQYVVFENNVFNAFGPYEGMNIKGMQSLVDNNTINGSFPGNGTVNFDFLRYNAQCSHRMYGSLSNYNNDYHWVLKNKINGSTPIFADFDSTSGNASTDPGCSNTNVGYVGKYTIDQNTVTSPPAGYVLTVVKGIEMDTPNVASGNVP